jgi:hypothetical protein
MSDPNLVYFANADNESVATTLEVLLAGHDIPIVKKHTGTGGYMELYTGHTNQTIEIYVSPDDAIEAARIVALFKSAPVDKSKSIFEDDGVKNLANKWLRKRQLYRIWIMLILMMGFTFVILSLFISN